jgi:hypothetical protein
MSSAYAIRTRAVSAFVGGQPGGDAADDAIGPRADEAVIRIPIGVQGSCWRCRSVEHDVRIAVARAPCARADRPLSSRLWLNATFGPIDHRHAIGGADLDRSGIDGTSRSPSFRHHDHRHRSAFASRASAAAHLGQVDQHITGVGVEPGLL